MKEMRLNITKKSQRTSLWESEWRLPDRKSDGLWFAESRSVNSMTSSLTGWATLSCSIVDTSSDTGLLEEESTSAAAAIVLAMLVLLLLFLRLAAERLTYAYDTALRPTRVTDEIAKAQHLSLGLQSIQRWRLKRTTRRSGWWQVICVVNITHTHTDSQRHCNENK